MINENEGDMELSTCFPIWDKLTPGQQTKLYSRTNFRKAKKGTIIHSGSMECTGLLAVQSGQLRAYIISPEGREYPLYRLFDMDICLFSASCMMNSIQFEIVVEAEKDTNLWIVPPISYKEVMEESAAAANYTNEIMVSCFSDMMRLIKQIMWKSRDKRIAVFSGRSRY